MKPWTLALVASVLAFGAWACSPGEREGASEAAPGARPGPKLIVLLSIDALRPDHLGHYGYPRFTSPSLDAIAREGVVFEDASATAPWTLPSHGSILTGLFPKRHQVVSTHTRLRDGVPTLASMLGDLGYRTAAVVNVAWLRRESFQLTRDFDDYASVDTTLDRRTPNTIVTDHAIRWVEEQGDEPLFLFAHWYDVHSDYSSEEAYEKLFLEPYEGSADGTGWQLKLGSFEDAYFAYCRDHYEPKACEFGPYRVDADSQRFRPDPRDLDHLRSLYDAGIRQLDTELGRLFTAMRKRGVMDEALIVVTSDHGQEFLEHGRLEHFITTYQETLRVPLVMRGPGLPSGARVAVPVSGVDIAPTLVSLAGGVPRPDLDGLDLSPLLRGEDPSRFRDRLLFAEASGGAEYNTRMEQELFPLYRSVRRGRYKLVWESMPERSALYDLETDPGETHDLSDAETELAAELRGILAQRHAADAEAAGDARVDLDPEELEQLRALGYVP